MEGKNISFSLFINMAPRRPHHPKRKAGLKVKGKRYGRKELDSPRRKVKARRAPRKALRTVQESIGQTTASKCFVANPRAHTEVAKLQKMIGQTQNWNSAQNQRNAASTAGQVAYDFPVLLGGQAQLQTISDYIMSTSGVTPGAPVRFLLEDILLDRTIFNRSTTPVTVKLYLVKARRDMWYSATTPMVFTSTNPGGTIYPWLGEPISCIQQGYNAQSNSGSLANTYLSPAVVPEDVDMFKKYFSVVHTEEIGLAEGGTHHFRLHIKYDKMVDSTIYSDSPLTGIEGFTYFMFMRCVGAPVYDSTNTNTVQSPVLIGAIDQYDFKFTQCWNPIIASKFTTQNPFTPGDVLKVINPGSGQPETLQSV